MQLYGDQVGVLQFGNFAKLGLAQDLNFVQLCFYEAKRTNLVKLPKCYLAKSLPLSHHRPSEKIETKPAA